MRLCENEANNMHFFIIYLMCVHAYSVFICINRELYETKLGFSGAILKLLEVIGVCLYFASVIQCLSNYSFWMYNLTNDSLLRFIDIKNNDAKRLLLIH